MDSSFPDGADLTAAIEAAPDIPEVASAARQSAGTLEPRLKLELQGEALRLEYQAV